MTVTLVAREVLIGANQTETFTVAPDSVAVGDLIVVTWAHQQNNPRTPTISGGSTWSAITIHDEGSAPDTYAAFAWKVADATDVNTDVTAGFTSGSGVNAGVAMSVFRDSGGGTWGLDGSAFTALAGTPEDTGSVSNVNADGVAVIGAYFERGSNGAPYAATTAGNLSYVHRGSPGTGGSTYGTAYQLLSATGSQSDELTAGGNAANTRTCIVVFSVSGGGGGAAQLTASLSADLIATGTATATKKPTASLSGSLTATGTATATSTVQLSASLSASLDATGVAGATAKLSASLSGSLTATGTATATTGLSAGLSASLVAAGVATATHELTASLSGSLTATATGVATRQFAASLSGSLTATGQATATRQLTSSLSASLVALGVATASGTPAPLSANLSGSLNATGVAAVAGAPAQFAASLSADLTATGAAAATKKPTASISGSLTATGTATAAHQMSASLSADLVAAGQATATQELSANLSGSLTATGSASAGGKLSVSLVGNLTASGTATATKKLTASLSGSLTGSVVVAGPPVVSTRRFLHMPVTVGLGPAELDLGVYRGDSWRLELNMVDEFGAIEDVSGRTYDAKISTLADVAHTVMSVDTSNAALGVVVVTMTPAQTAALTAPMYQWDLAEIDGADVWTLFKGTVRPSEDLA